ncbi:hypothetical protein BO70DRAFT_32902 [Aspergillus heteromorphus CBS 117.55]|uniref:Uncharacterized protein n=1 Tax=Aspergillus heteromorphus CBS 117.55 TaxID=1448321 RepID=A0A317WC69_9EURO|nr:uncharacterized protein BO70DRAFT_32902 [Aspergillus heteromorphus CBS 117.55]PWY82967.1 hypothetical protein BO70DRAFT_32902 [Aspergillus heteromorphus CBS 117.55]
MMALAGHSSDPFFCLLPSAIAIVSLRSTQQLGYLPSVFSCPAIGFLMDPVLGCSAASRERCGYLTNPRNQILPKSRPQRLSHPIGPPFITNHDATTSIRFVLACSFSSYILLGASRFLLCPSTPSPRSHPDPLPSPPFQALCRSSWGVIDRCCLSLLYIFFPHTYSTKHLQQSLAL